MDTENKLILYKDDEGKVNVNVRFADEDVWLTREKRREIRNSTAEFLIFQIEGKEQGIEVYYKDNTVWCTQKAMGMLFDCSSDNIGLHLKNIYEIGELQEGATAEKISVVRQEGERMVNRTLQFYNLDAVISVGYRVNSIRAK